jgi:hypothetical protein
MDNVEAIFISPARSSAGINVACSHLGKAIGRIQSTRSIAQKPQIPDRLPPLVEVRLFAGDNLHVSI